jgi:hypothetical protein
MYILNKSTLPQIKEKEENTRYSQHGESLKTR